MALSPQDFERLKQSLIEKKQAAEKVTAAPVTPGIPSKAQQPTCIISKALKQPATKKGFGQLALETPIAAGRDIFEMGKGLLGLGGAVVSGLPKFAGEVAEQVTKPVEKFKEVSGALGRVFQQPERVGKEVVAPVVGALAAGIPEEFKPAKKGESILAKGAEAFTAQAKERLANPVDTALTFFGAKSLFVPDPQKIANTKTRADAIVARIVQGEKKDLPGAVEALGRVKTKGVKNLDDLAGNLQANTKVLADKMDDVVFADKTTKRLKDLKITTEAGGKGFLKDIVKQGKVAVKNNYVNDALKHMEELYKGDAATGAMLKSLRQQAEETGLSGGDINKILKTYRQNFGSKVFDSSGAVKTTTSVSIAKYESTLRGLRDTAKSMATDKKLFEAFNKQMSNNIKTTDLIEELSEKAFIAANKIKQTGTFETLGAKAISLIDKLMLGGIKGLGKTLLPKLAGEKNLSPADLNNLLAKNLKLLKKADTAKTTGPSLKALMALGLVAGQKK